MDTSVGSRYRGDFVAWTGGCGFLGEGGGGPIAPHSHYAIQLAIGMPTGLRVLFGRHGQWQSCAAALVPSRATHSIDVNDCDMSVVLFIEPETPEGKALSALAAFKEAGVDGHVSVQALQQRVVEGAGVAHLRFALERNSPEKTGALAACGENDRLHLTLMPGQRRPASIVRWRGRVHPFRKGSPLGWPIMRLDGEMACP